MKILAIDPGVTSGYCFATLEGTITRHINEETVNNLSINITPYQQIDDVEDCWDRIEKFQPDYLICEDFEYRNKARAGLVLFSVQLIGVCNLYALKAAKCSLTLQTAATGKGYYTNDLLKKVGVYKPGAAWEHSMDATRHLLHWLTFREGYQFIQGKDIKDIVRLVV